MKIKELYEYNPDVIEHIKNEKFFEFELDEDYKIPLGKLAKYYSVNLNTDQNRYGQAFDVCKKILGYHEELNDITSRAVRHLTNQLILPNKLIELYLDKHKDENKIEDYEDIDVDDFVNYMSETLELSREFIIITLRQQELIY